MSANISLKYIQEKNLPLIFDLSVDYFRERKGKEFIEREHYFIPPTKSKTKKAVLWDIEAVDNWLTSAGKVEDKRIKIDPEIENLLKRR